ncbi:MAG: gephyrin-like molybdotransferase Glp [Aurantimonas endophytica]|uniref:Molybdopterin molybdenumtransferase n=1 Tax=Aurantimonas endophytica TaxID=1522175 RepID=A0A7W6MN50_9HYPH|nr:gephyrin-like molybdotransferase Glp [Aurantimonas endophytica]MBB4001487.1 molybdopterin molybdotransferase [Aurantimonas endophytica]MCO6402872.1 molybdopterin molybdenumtransferase MoeA [Aurantimonas endophytica]
MSLISVDAAYRLLLQDAAPIGRMEDLPLSQAAGRVLGTDIVALRTQPSFDASAMDGYAVRSADLAAGLTPLRLIGEAAAGRAFDGAVGAGETVRIFTGAPVPAGADAILIQEDTTVEASGRIMPCATVAERQHVRFAGVDFREGDKLLPGGCLLSPGAIALAASGGHPTLTVRQRPRVAVLATGDELVLPGVAPGPAQIVASNGFGVAAMVAAAGGEALDYGIAPDDSGAIAARLDQALAEGADIFVTIGGASVGDHDLVGAVFAERGVALDFWKVAMRPGKPLMAGRLRDMRIVGLPGNPASSMVAAKLFLAPLVSRLAGRPERPLTRNAILGAAVPENGERTDFVRSVVELADDGTATVTPLPRQDSSLLSTYAHAQGLLVRPPGAAPAEAGQPCQYVPLD